MKLLKAIEILELYMKPSDDIEPVDFDTATKLGIKALKRVKAAKISQTCLCKLPLSGETET